MSAVDESNGWSVLRWRVDNNEKRLGKLDDWRRGVDIERASMAEVVKQTQKDVTELGKKSDAHDTKLDDLRKLILTTVITFSSGIVILCLSILAAVGKIG